ncbi:MAG: 2-C-methyl-D-erythritol 4-phosphate cytidylyltransferase [Thermoleophilia bacterium]|jgi:2-C-methyl-D-erythritol 4-phosphate cytidylyltransferase
MASRRPTLAMVLAAAGYGTRLSSGLPKQYVPLLGIPMLQRTMTTISSCPEVDAMLVVVNVEDVEYCDNEIRLEHIGKVLRVVAGDEKRPFSVQNGLRALAELGDWDLVGVHDGARPLVTRAELRRVLAALEADPTLDGAIPALPSIDTVKVVGDDGLITSTPQRSRLFCAQTPQIFRRQVIMDAYAQPDSVVAEATDDSSLVELRGGRVAVVEGSPENFKITERMDLRRAEQVLAERRYD